MRVERHERHRTLGAIDVLVVCTANLCRSPMVQALLDRALADRGVAAHVHSAGFLFEGEPATDHGIAVMASRGLDTSGHRSRIVSADITRDADVIVCMERRHVVDAVSSDPACWPRTFTLKELVLKGEAVPRQPDEPLTPWLARCHQDRTAAEMLRPDPAYDVADPFGGRLADYARTADELATLVGRLASMLAGSARATVKASTQRMEA